MTADRVKVIHLITLLEFGGAQGNTIHTVKNLNPSRFEALLWSGRGAYWDQRVANVRFFRSLVRPLNPLFDLIALFRLIVALMSEKPRILHTHSSKAGIIGRIAGKWAGVPVVVHTFHGFGFNDRQKPWTRWLFVFLERLTAPLAKKLIFVSKSNWREAEDKKIGDPSQYELIRSGIPLGTIKDVAKNAIQNSLHAEFNIPIAAKVVLTIGAFKPQKNLFDFLLIAKRVLAQSPDSYFLILGDGELRSQLENKIEALGLSGRVIMPGWREDAAILLSQSNVYVMTSLWEGLPRALLEAMALGIPSVCYETDGVKDLLRREDGTAFRQGDIEGMAASIVKLLNNKEECSRLAKIFQERVGIEFDIDHMVRQQEALYERLLQVDNQH